MQKKGLTIEKRLVKAMPDVRVVSFDELDSTNSEAKRQFLSGEATPALFVASQQSAGRGRMGRSFYSPGGTGVYFSYLYCPKNSLGSAVTVTSAASVAVMRAIRETCGIETQIKWVNDLYDKGRKVCGILCESAVYNDRRGIIVGIGINLSTSDFPPELAQKAGSLGVDIDPCDLIIHTVAHLRAYLQEPDSRAWLEDYRAHSCVIGRPIRWIEGGTEFGGKAVGIDCDGGLQVEDADGNILTLRTGEISVMTDLS